MANKKISELAVATAPTGAELAEIVQGGVNKQTTLQDIANLAPGGGGTVTSVTGTADRITSTGGATPAIDISGTFEALLGKIAQRIDQNNSATTSAQLAATISDETGTGFAVFSASPALTGTPTAPTAAGGTNTTQLATTAFVLAAQLSSVSSSTAGGTITLDMNSLIQRMHIGSASFAGPKTLAMSNVTNSLLFNFIFEITNVAAILTVPADWLMSDLAFDGTTWTPPQIGKYELGGSWDGTSWYVKIQGPFS